MHRWLLAPSEEVVNLPTFHCLKLRTPDRIRGGDSYTPFHYKGKPLARSSTVHFSTVKVCCYKLMDGPECSLIVFPSRMNWQASKGTFVIMFSFLSLKLTCFFIPEDIVFYLLRMQYPSRNGKYHNAKRKLLRLRHLWENMEGDWLNHGNFLAGFHFPSPFLWPLSNK